MKLPRKLEEIWNNYKLKEEKNIVVIYNLWEILSRKREKLFRQCQDRKEKNQMATTEITGKSQAQNSFERWSSPYQQFIIAKER
jgi:hypothetical protein